MLPPGGNHTAAGADLTFQSPRGWPDQQVDMAGVVFDQAPLVFLQQHPPTQFPGPGTVVNSLPGSVQSLPPVLPGMVNGPPAPTPRLNQQVYFQAPYPPQQQQKQQPQHMFPGPTNQFPTVGQASKDRSVEPGMPVVQNGFAVNGPGMAIMHNGQAMSPEALAEKARRDTERVASEDSCASFYKKGWFLCTVTFLVWMFSGIAFYMSFQQWPFFMSLYYTLQAGLSIGFGAPFEDEICERTDIWESNSARYYVTGDNRYDDPVDNGRGGCLAGDLSKLFTTILVLTGSSIAASAVGIIANAIFSRPGGWYKDLLEELYLEELRKKAAETETILDDIPIWIRIQLRKGLVQAVISLTIWIGVGVLYGMLSHQRMSFLTALYFAVTSVSTAGLEGLKALGEDTEFGAEIDFADLNDGHFFFISIYVLIGIPLYAWALTSIASGYVGAMQKKEVMATMYRPISEEEFKLMSLLGHMKNDEDEPGASEVVDMFEFVECQLLRLNKVSVTDLYEIKRRFMELDQDRSGEITKEELMATGTTVTGVVDPQVERALEELELIRQKIISGERDERDAPHIQMGQGVATANPNQHYDPSRVRGVA